MRASQRVGAKYMNSQYWRSNSHGRYWNMKAEFSRSDLGQDRAHRGQPVDDRDLGVGILVLELARDRAGGEVVALADVGGDDQDLARLGLGVGLAGGDDRRVLLLALAACGLLVAPVDVAAHALGERRRRASSRARARRAALETILPPKSPGGPGVWTISTSPISSLIVSAICLIVTVSSLARL